MEIPKFLLADNSEYDDAYVFHTEYPRFLLNVNTDEVEWFDDVNGDQDLDENQVKDLIDDAFNFFDDEIKAYDDEEEDEEDYGV